MYKRAKSGCFAHCSARSHRLLGRNHLNDHEQLCDKHGERFTEEELMALAAEESLAAHEAHARATPAADDRVASEAEDHGHSASEDTAHSNSDEHAPSKKGSSFAKDDTVSDDEELHHLATALDASTTDATAAASGLKARYNRNGPISGMPTDHHVRPLGPADGVQASAHAKFWDGDSDDSGKSESIGSGSEHSGSGRDHPTASPATKGKRRRPGIFSKEYWMQAALKLFPRPSGRQHSSFFPAQAAQKRQRLPQLGHRAQRRRWQCSRSGQRRKDGRWEARSPRCRGPMRVEAPSVWPTSGRHTESNLLKGKKRQIHHHKGLTHRSCSREFSRSA